MIRCRPRFITLILLLAGLLPFSGCTNFKPPSIKLANVRLVERTDEAVAFHFDLVLENPNDEPIELREFRYALTLDEAQIYRGRRAAFSTLHPGTISEMTLPAVVRFDLLNDAGQTLPEAMNYQLTGTLLYETTGELAEILLDTGVRKPEVRFSVGGRLDLLPDS
ncbi:MAG: hypothetical protein O7G85_00495 [Planctomycetota bacterium]|nr:hypothetical protein [Planctomycetota bacterium]